MESFLWLSAASKVTAKTMIWRPKSVHLRIIEWVVLRYRREWLWNGKCHLRMTVFTVYLYKMSFMKQSHIWQKVTYDIKSHMTIVLTIVHTEWHTYKYIICDPTELGRSLSMGLRIRTRTLASLADLDTEPRDGPQYKDSDTLEFSRPWYWAQKVPLLYWLDYCTVWNK